MFCVVCLAGGVVCAGGRCRFLGIFFAQKKTVPHQGGRRWFLTIGSILMTALSIIQFPLFFFPIRRRSICGLQTRKKRNIDIRINIDRFFLNVGVTLGSPERPESSILFFKGWDIFFPSKVWVTLGSPGRPEISICGWQTSTKGNIDIRTNIDFFYICWYFFF